MYDVVIIGAGVVGAFVARDLAKYKLNVLLLDKEMDVADGATKANSAIVHAGYDPEPGSLKAELNVKGNAMFDRICSELSVPFKRKGSLVVAFSDEEMKTVYELYERGLKNGVQSLKVIKSDELFSMEPNINKNAYGALYAGTAGITSPYELCIACVENAVENGVKLELETKVNAINKKPDGFDVITSSGTFETRYIVNAAGLFSDDINKMLEGEKFNLVLRKGEYCLLDKSASQIVNHTIFQTPTSKGKGVLVTPTVHGNILIGPNAVNVNDKLNLSTTAEGLIEVIDTARKTTDKISTKDIITSFSGLRASVISGDFIINSPIHGAVNAAAIDSPGLTAAPAISEMIVGMLKEMGLKLNKKAYDPIRHVSKRFAEMSNKERAEAIRKNPLYGRVICRCETVTEGEIVDAIRRPAGARTVDGVKRRVRAGMGRCQGGFCMPKVIEILSRELGIAYMDVVKDSKDGYIFTGRLKDNYRKQGGPLDE